MIKGERYAEQTTRIQEDCGTLRNLTKFYDTPHFSELSMMADVYV